MIIHLLDKKLLRSAGTDDALKSTYGKIMAKKIRRRLDDLKAADSLEDVRHLPGRFHELKGDRKGQWACDLEHPQRLIFEPTITAIPVSKEGSYIWKDIKEINIIEIEDYH